VSTNENAIQAATELDIGIFILHPDKDGSFGG
jgi:predicted aldo/keto reductase-like oxidoreductase